MDHAPRPLDNIGILITRPEHQSDFLRKAILDLGGDPVIFPVLVISDTQNQTSLQNSIARLDEYDLCIFVSPNAVHRTLPLIHNKRPFPPHVKIAVVGKGSADALKTYGLEKFIMPDERFDSEALLELEALQHVSGKKIAIFRGNGGRPLLGDTLKKRGAILEYVECYYRGKPDIDATDLLAKWSQGRINAVIITSSEGLHNLFDMIGQLGQQLLKETPVFTAHERIAHKAREAGLEKVVQARGTGDRGIMESLLEYYNKQRIFQN